MGRRCFGVMYGCSGEPDLDDFGEDRFLLKYTSMLGREDFSCWPMWAHADGFSVLGFWVFQGDDYGTCSFPLARPESVIEPGLLDLVRERWRIFSAWCAEQGHILGEPELFLMQAETG